MQSQRFFIGNLPAGTTEKDVNKAFKDYGEVTSIELKEKENLVDPGSVKVLAFVTLNLFDGDVDFCIKKLSSKPINGQYVRVSVAKESFLDRLKREREENTKGAPKTNGNTYTAAPDIQPPVNKSKKFLDTEEDGDAGEMSQSDEPVLITKKRAINSMRNGRIVIESTNCAPVHIIGKQKDVKRLNEKSFDSEKKRKESVKKKKNQYQLQKSLIQKSLSSVDQSKTKKIIFDDADKEDGDDGSSANAKPLFQDSDQEDESHGNDFAIRSEYEGAKGAALMKLQSQMNLDSRFKIDHKFVDEVAEEPARNENSERDWQYGILEQVVGSKVTNVSHPKGHEKKKLKMVRYDPSKANQEEFLIKSKEPPQPMEEDDEESAAAVEADKTEVSKEVFYVVSDNLSNSLKTRGDGFSLLSIFGKAEDKDDKEGDQLEQEKILISKNDKGGALNPFTYDSSDSEHEQEVYPTKTSAKPSAKDKEAKENSKEAAKLFVESFFIPKNDVRLKEGKSFFRSNRQSEKIENYDEVKDKLKTLINTKINKSKRQLKGKGRGKPMRGR